MTVKGFKKDTGYGSLFEGIVFLAYSRTPFGRLCGGFSEIPATELGVLASRDAIRKANIDAKNIDFVCFANVGASSADAFFTPRHVGLYSGVPLTTPALLVQRICGSGFEAIAQAAEHLALGKATLALAGGTENLTRMPTVSYANRLGYPIGRPVFVDYLWEAFLDTAVDMPMGMTAEVVGKRFGIARKECDEFAVLSQARYAKAFKSGFLKDEIVPVTNCVLEVSGLKPRKVRLPKKVDVINADEHARETTVEKLAELTPVYSKDGVLTAGNSCGIVDGAAAVVMTTEEYAKAHNLKPIARLVSSGTCGVEPQVMGIGPVPASRIAMEIAGLKINQVDLVEINEAFAAQYIAVEKELGLDREKTNIDGGAIAYGHPYGATGVRLTGTLIYKLKRLNKKFGMSSACIGGGQGMTLIIENI